MTFVEQTRQTLLNSLAEVLPPSAEWTALDYPMHENCGDAALYLGLEAAAAHVGARVVRNLDRVSFRRHLLRPDTLAVFQAGGNWGGLYPTHHQLRMRFLAETKGRPAVQMPQSIEYADESRREELRRAVGEHGRFVLLVRDRRSFELARADYDCEVRLVPDLAFSLGPLTRRPATVARVVQRRTDREASRTGGAEETFDWLQVEPFSRTGLLLAATRRVNAQQRRTAAAPVATLTNRLCRSLARTSLDRAVSLLSRGETVITDRLHGHLISTLAGIPHVVVNDKFGKVKALYDTWTHASDLSRFAANWDEAFAMAEDLRVG
ncbi:polysaccharide pyruvyl transferase family protein [Kineococcus gynurae]|uniref:Polysaccharide pyruvyl transferase family protein n=1 Tax=Kineococcus gynurae TaxID=452979 RepID=A0ABV5LWU4_9ACTN